MTSNTRILAITGGIGGAKLALGLANLLGYEQLAFLVNTGDDFTHLGLAVSPDIDTLVYTLSGRANRSTGWGRSDESWNFMAALEDLGGEQWFALGDKDLAMHVLRTRLLAEGLSLTEITAKLAAALDISHPIFPMCDAPLRTRVQTLTRLLDFQTYFVHEKCGPVVTGFHFDNADKARMSQQLLAWLDECPPTGIVLCPSNPFVSIDPILQVAGVRELLRQSDAPVVAVSPVVGGEAIRGPTVKMMQELGIPATAHSVAVHYADFLNGFVLDRKDADQVASIEEGGIATRVAQTVMRTLDDRVALARDCIDFLNQLSSR